MNEAAGPELERLRPQLQEAWQEAARRAARLGRPVLVSVTVSLPPFDPLNAFQRAPLRGARGWDAVLWARPSAGLAWVGWGTALALTGRGPGRFRQVAQAWRRVVEEAVLRRDGAAAPARAETGHPAAPVAVGGFAFDAGGPLKPRLWAGFPDALMAVPRVALGLQGDAAWLVVSAAVGPDDGSWDPAPGRWAPARDTAAGLVEAGIPPEAAALLEDFGTGLGARPRHEPADPAGAARSSHLLADGRLPREPFARSDDARDWAGKVEAAKAAIRSGQLAKVVLARAVRVRRRQPFDLAAVLQALWRDYPECHLFALRRRGAAFVGATPEPLVTVRGSQVCSASLAGSTARGRTEHEDRRLARELLDSPKERQEHAVARDALLEALSEACTDVRAPAHPEVLRLPTIQHLCTPVTARLRDGRTVLDLVERLHPTPAVGGWPKAPALDWIRRHEGLDRGWYAAPVGWMDAAGSGEFAVAIRSALVRGSSATLFAGCGIMADSDPDREYRESWLKLRPMLQALQRSSRG